MSAEQRSPRRRIGSLAALLRAATVTLTLILGLGACSAAEPSSDPASTQNSVSPDPVGQGPAASTPPPTTGPTEPTGPAGTPPAQIPTTPRTASEPPTIAPPVTSLVLPAADPVTLSIPAIGVTSTLSALGRNPDGTVEVPSLDDPDAGAGWFRDSPPPGALGPAIILGHVDSRQYGPGVFYHLRDLQPGDTIDITRADGTIAVFTVDTVDTVPKATFPTQQVYGNIDHAGLRLITCGGDFDEAARSYDDNVIAFASFVSSR